MKGHVGSRVIIQQDIDKLKTELQEAHAQIAGHQRKQMIHNDKIALARFRISTLEITLKDIQALNVNRMASKRTSTSIAPAMNQVMHAYDATIPPQAHIAPPTVLPPSLVLLLLPMFNPQDFFLPMEILPPRKQVYCLSLSSTDLSTQPQAIKIGENYHGTLDTRVIIQQDLDKLKTELQEAHAQIAGHQRKQMIHNDKIALARFRISTLEITLKDIQARHQLYT
nr:hypothetical protein [Tanacetum cinerariifolium]